MRRIDVGLLTALAVLAFMALFSEKKILVAEGYAYTREELDQGRQIYDDFCRSCHGQEGRNAPQAGKAEDWNDRIGQGMTVLITHAIKGYRGKNWMPPKGGEASLTPEEVALAVAYMVRRIGSEVPL